MERLTDSKTPEYYEPIFKEIVPKLKQAIEIMGKEISDLENGKNGSYGKVDQEHYDQSCDEINKKREKLRILEQALAILGQK